MKKIIFGLLLTAVSTVTGFAQNFEGKITLKMTYDDLPDNMKGQEAMLPTESIMYYKNNNSRVETNTMFGTQIFIINEKKETTLLIDMMGMKIAIPMDIPEESDEQKPKIEYVKGDKKIAGYKCKKAIVKYLDEEMEVYYTEEIKDNSNKISGLKGFPMEYSTNANGLKVKNTVTEVKKETVDENLFKIGDDFKVMTIEEFQSMLGGGGEED